MRRELREEAQNWERLLNKISFLRSSSELGSGEPSGLGKSCGLFLVLHFSFLSSLCLQLQALLGMGPGETQVRMKEKRPFH